MNQDTAYAMSVTGFFTGQIAAPGMTVNTIAKTALRIRRVKTMAKVNIGPPSPPKTRVSAAMVTGSLDFRDRIADEVKRTGNKTVTPGSKIEYMAVETVDYHNGFAISFNFSRWTATATLLDYRDIIGFCNGDKAKTVVTKLRALADRIEAGCVDKVQGKEKPF